MEEKERKKKKDKAENKAYNKKNKHKKDKQSEKEKKHADENKKTKTELDAGAANIEKNAEGDKSSEEDSGRKPDITKRIIIAAAAIALGLLFVFDPELFYSFIGSIESGAEEEMHQSGLYAAFIDVGQGDSILLVSPNGKTMLIDAGTPDSFNSIESFLNEKEIKKLDVVIATHTHSDHIGSMKRIIDDYSVGRFYMPEAVNTTTTFDKLLSSLERKKVKVKAIWGGKKSTINWDDDVEVRVLSPIKGNDYEQNLNDMSLVVKVTYGETSLLLTGDAEKTAEVIMLKNDAGLLKANVLKLGHHGSSTSSSKAFLDAVSPDIVVISVGADNNYGHPHKETMERLSKMDVKVYRTDKLGTVCMMLDGKEVKLLDISKK